MNAPPDDRLPSPAAATSLALTSAAADPDARMVRGIWILWAIGAAVGVALLLRAPGEYFPLFTPLWALLLFWPLWRGGRRLWRAIVDAPHQEWNGSYFEFDGQHVRVLVDEEHALWVCADDVFDALGIKGRGRHPERVRLDAGRDGLSLLPGARPLWFSERGLLAWLARRRGERIVAFARWLDAEVLGPQRRRRRNLGADKPNATSTTSTTSTT